MSLYNTSDLFHGLCTCQRAFYSAYSIVLFYADDISSYCVKLVVKYSFKKRKAYLCRPREDVTLSKVLQGHIHKGKVFEYHEKNVHHCFLNKSNLSTLIYRRSSSFKTHQKMKRFQVPMTLTLPDI